MHESLTMRPKTILTSCCPKVQHLVVGFHTNYMVLKHAIVRFIYLVKHLLFAKL